MIVFIHRHFNLIPARPVQPEQSTETFSDLGIVVVMAGRDVMGINIFKEGNHEDHSL